MVNSKENNKFDLGVKGLKGKQISGISAEEKLCWRVLNIVLEFKQEQGWLKSTELYH